MDLFIMFYELMTFQIHAIKYYNCNKNNLNPNEEKIYSYYYYYFNLDNF